MFYKNGKLAGAKDTFIGAYSTPTNFFQGIIDDVAIFYGALATEEIKKIVDRGLENQLYIEAASNKAIH